MGASTNTIGPSPGLRYGCALMCTMAGKRNDSVFPEPVCAMPTTSRPDSAIGQPCVGPRQPRSHTSEQLTPTATPNTRQRTWDWMGVGPLKPAFFTSSSTYLWARDNEHVSRPQTTHPRGAHKHTCTHTHARAHTRSSRSRSRSKRFGTHSGNGDSSNVMTGFGTSRP